MRILIGLLLLSGYLSFGQQIGETFRPCGVVYFMVDKMPRVSNDLSELNKRLADSVSLSNKEKKLSGYSAIGFTVNCNGRVGAFKVSRDGFKGTSISARIINALESILTAQPGEQNGNRVDCTSVIAVTLKMGNISLTLPTTIDTSK